jgi:hypothetical protein
VAKELAKCKLDSVNAQEVRWDKGGTEPAKDNTLLNGIGAYYVLDYTACSLHPLHSVPKYK